MDVKKAIFYSHGGSGNHGCEAIVRSSIKILPNYSRFIVFSNNPDEDRRYGIDKIAKIKNSYTEISKNKFHYFFFLLKMKFLKKDYYFYKEKYRKITNETEDSQIAFSVGGDNYCYKGYNEELRAINEKFKQKNIRTILWGCSIEPEILDNDLVRDLSEYSIIFARESITYNALLQKGLNNVKLFPDSAFQLDRIDLPLPKNFIEKKMVGINISPLILEHEENKGLLLENIDNLINHILKNTDFNIALIPHVVWSHNDDRIPLAEILKKHGESERIVLLEDHNAIEQKGFIARCRFLFAARTHASVAAYSQHVPTVVLGYSVKSKGIAKDIFGSYENFVVPVKNLHTTQELVNSFEFLRKNEDEILNKYEEVMPKYKEKCLKAFKEI